LLRKYICFLLSILFFCEFSFLNAESREKAGADSKESRLMRLVHLHPFKNRSSANINLPVLEKIFEECLAQRKSPQFALREGKTADLNIQVEILKYAYSKKDISNQRKKQSLLVDAFAEKNTAALDVHFIVRDRKDFLLWEKKLHAEYVQNNMTPEEALTKVFRKACRLFIGKCFGKTSPLSESHI
jgi:hypothetical protein